MMTQEEKDEYERLDKLALSLYVDYGINKLPINIFDLCTKLGIRLVPYSELPKEMYDLSMKLSNDGYSVLKIRTIFYNDSVSKEHPRGRVLFTLAHELKHILDKDIYEDIKIHKYANHFARYVLCPIVYLVIIDFIFDAGYISKCFNLTSSAASNALKAYLNRVQSKGSALYPYEHEFSQLFS